MTDLFTPPKVGRRMFMVWRRNRDAWYKFYKASMVGNVAEPIFFLLAFGLGLSRFISDIDGVPYIEYIAPGLMAASAMNASSFECTFGSFTRMSTQKTYDAIMVTPVNIEEVAAGDILWGATKGLLSAVIILVVLFAAGLVGSVWLIAAPPVFLLEGVMFASMGLIVTAFAPSYDYYAYYFSLVISPMFFFSGIFFPLSTLPGWVRDVAWFTPLAHVVNLSRAFSTGDVPVSLLGDLAWMLVFTAVTSWLAIKFIKRRLVK
ncbi:MAG TPA: ABC transporter permease [Nitrospirota bacterium]